MNWPEGSSLDPTHYPIHPSAIGSGWFKQTFAVAVTGHESDFPTLARAAHRTIPAFAPKIEWLDASGHRWNFTQIFRTPWTEPSADRGGVPQDRSDQFLWNHLQDIEWALVHGTPQRLPHLPLSFTGGVIHFLGREETGPDDKLILRPLAGRELMMRSWLNPGGSRTSEWLSEVSLQVSLP